MILSNTLEAQLPIYWVPGKSLYTFILSITQGPTIWVPGLLGIGGVNIWSGAWYFPRKLWRCKVQRFAGNGLGGLLPWVSVEGYPDSQINVA